jgi:hypothetical protein
MSQNPNYGECHARQVIEGVTDEHLRGIPEM